MRDARRASRAVVVAQAGIAGRFAGPVGLVPARFGGFTALIARVDTREAAVVVDRHTERPRDF